ncbi:MAG: methylmalonyl-CoA carboxyltransferase, partial [Actinobacteria bacterium]
TFEELGGAATHATRSGVAHFSSPDDDACLEDARYLLSFLPQNNLDSPPYAEPSDPRDREDAELDSIVPDNPNKPYDIKAVIERVVDDGQFLEVHERFAENIVCGFARLGGHSVGIVGNQPRSLAG